MKVTVDSQILTVQVFIEGCLHIHIVREKFLALNTWVWTHKNSYTIEFIMQGGSFYCEYDTLDKFNAVLTELKRVL